MKKQPLQWDTPQTTKKHVFLEGDGDIQCDGSFLKIKQESLGCADREDVFAEFPPSLGVSDACMLLEET